MIKSKTSIKNTILIAMFLFLGIFMSACGLSAQVAETEPEPVEVSLTASSDEVFDWSYLSGFCGISSFNHAVKDNRCLLDFSKLPTQRDFILKELEEHGYPYIIDDNNRFFIFYYQDNDQPWSQMEHGDSTVEKSGCGSVCLSMVLTSLTGNIKDYTPGKIVRFQKTEHIASPNLSVRSIPVINRVMNTGCRIRRYSDDLDFDIVDQTLKKGGYIILDQLAWANDKSIKVFGGRNHYIVIRAGSRKKGYYIANPLYGYSRPGSSAQYAPQNEKRIPAELFSALYYYTILPPKEAD